MGIRQRIPRGRNAVALAAAALAAAVGLGALPFLDTGSTTPEANKTDASTTAPLDEDTAQDKARSTKKRVEVTALRTATTTTYALPDGQFEYQAHTAAIRAKADGEWQDIDTTLTRTRDGDWVPKATNSPAVFSGGGADTGTRAARDTHRAMLTSYTGDATATDAEADESAVTGSELVSFTSEGHTLTLTWPGSIPEPVVQDDRALYRDILDGVDLLLTARDTGFSHVLIVKTRAAAASTALKELTYGLTSPDLTFTIDPTTDAVTAKDADGTEIAVSPTPYMWDSAGEPDATTGEDPEPSAPVDEIPSPSYSEEEEAEVSEETDAPSDSDDTSAPTVAPSSDPTTSSEEPSSAGTTDDTETPDADTPDPDTTADAAAYITGTGTGTGTGTTALQAAYRTATDAESAALTADEIFALDGLAGPGIGGTTAVADASLSGNGDSDGSGSDHEATLTVTPDSDFLASEDTELPLFIDPPFVGHKEAWTTAYTRYPGSSFWNGTNFNDGTSEARVGYESTTYGKSRSFFRLDWSPALKGAHITSASITALETYSWSCTGRTVQLWHTGGISSKTTWNNQPDWKTQIDSKDVAHGYSSSCPDEYLKFDAKSLAQDAADGGWEKITIGLKAAADGEDDAGAWKKFKATGDHSPYLKAYYNRRPTTPSSLTMTPGPDCDRTSPYAHVGKSDLVFAATSSDKDGNLASLDFELWHIGDFDDKILDKNVSTDAAGHASTTVASSKFTNGYIYSWRVRALDDQGEGAASSYAPTADPQACRFVYDSAAPNSPEVSSTDFPAANDSGSVWSKVKFGTSGSFTFAPDTDTDVTKFEYSFNSTAYSGSKTVTAGASATVVLKPPVAGPNVLYVRAVDSAGNVSEGTKHLFYVTPRDTADAVGDTTGDGVPDLLVIDESGDLRLYPSSSTGDLHVGLEAAHRDGTALTGNGESGYWKSSTDNSPALIAHGGDLLPGDGVTDLIARMPDGNLYAYRGDGYGSVDVSQRMSIRLPSGSPDPGTFTQVILGDYNLDSRPDLFATTDGGGLWAFSGYTGASFSTATQIAASSWAVRDLVSIGDHNSDGEPDLLWRSGSSGNLYVRYGIADSGGGSTIASLSSAAGSLTGIDTTYATGWTEDAKPMPRFYGTPDVTGDGIPDIWALDSDGTVDVYPGGSAAIGTATQVISASTTWATRLALG
ncbi:FG-GAP-like repeat-containing protein [Streptomyces sp. NBC_00038]|uniref:DNRLRE domain-containing protein n=1 Tax=Streptomyces sp. NBC_00038 TaxID=2903615 RepID=UPI002252C43D|nr:FG-GAP-like repeat-containing protein [Streptomyces sp. NBC_00038]MCX5560865.1 DNRLRE domain-containing protein [Streptomyces sp. NBC_00038]